MICSPRLKRLIISQHSKHGPSSKPSWGTLFANTKYLDLARPNSKVCQEIQVIYKNYKQDEFWVRFNELSRHGSQKMVYCVLTITISNCRLTCLHRVVSFKFQFSLNFFILLKRQRVHNFATYLIKKIWKQNFL